MVNARATPIAKSRSELIHYMHLIYYLIPITIYTCLVTLNFLGILYIVTLWLLISKMCIYTYILEEVIIYLRIYPYPHALKNSHSQTYLVLVLDIYVIA